MNIEKRNEIFEQFLAILLTSHHFNGPGLLLQNNTTSKNRIYPGTRLGLNRVPNSDVKINTHYSLGDLGLVPRQQNIQNKATDFQSK